MTIVDRKIVLWGTGTKRVLRAHWMLIELGLEYRCVPIRTRTTDMDRADFLALSPAKKLPALQDGDLVLTESAAIVTYLAERYARTGCQLIPTSIEQRARYFEWMSYICMEMDATSLYVLRRHEGLPAIYGDSPVASAAARQYFNRMCAAAANRISDPGQYLLGSTFSGVDIVMTTCLDWAIEYQLPLPKALIEYRGHLIERPAYRLAVMANLSPHQPVTA